MRSMLSVINVSKKFNTQDVLKNISFSLDDHEVVGLIGPNGSGKTTILKLINGEVIPDTGSIQTDNEKIGYLPQYPQFDDLTVEGFLRSKLGNPNLEYRVEQSLNDLGLSAINKSQKAESLSGGQKTKLSLASLFLTDEEPTVLLLDEPTNNLDIEGLHWLEIFIKEFKGSVLLTSHDRYFLDETVDRIVELENGEIKNYGGNYSFYSEQKLDEKRAYLAKYKENVVEVKRLERLITEKKERAKKLSKDKGRDKDKYAKYFFSQKSAKIDNVAKSLESRLGRTETLEKPKDRVVYPFQFEGQTHNDKFIIGAHNMYKSFDGNEILKGISFTISGDQHVWLAGSNGSGKSTLLKILAGKLAADDGEVIIGTNVKVGYFSQDVSHLDMSKYGIDELRSTGISEADCYKYAANLHLSADDLRKPISSLSRGQITKLEFVKLLIGQNNLLILDEPTNHLEIETREEIEEALGEYQGAILVASHDRYFLEEIGIDREITLKLGSLNES